MLAKLASGSVLFYNELLSWPRISRQPLRPVSARSGRKEFIADEVLINDPTPRLAQDSYCATEVNGEGGNH